MKEKELATLLANKLKDLDGTVSVKAEPLDFEDDEPDYVVDARFQNGFGVHVYCHCWSGYSIHVEEWLELCGNISWHRWYSSWFEDYERRVDYTLEEVFEICKEVAETRFPWKG